MSEHKEDEKTFPIAVDWGMGGVVNIKAETIEEAIEVVERDDSIPLPEDGEYIDGSFTVNRQMTNYLIREEQKKKERRE